MAQRSPYNGTMGKEATSQITMDEAMDMADLPPEKQGTAIDRKDMHRMGKQQVWLKQHIVEVLSLTRCCRSSRGTSRLFLSSVLLQSL